MQNKVWLSYTDHQSHSCHADKNPYRHDGRADNDSYRHDGRAYSLSQMNYRHPKTSTSIHPTIGDWNGFSTSVIDIQTLQGFNEGTARLSSSLLLLY